MVYLVIAIVAVIILALGYWQLKKAERSKDAIYANVLDMYNKQDDRINKTVDTMKMLVAKMKEISGADPVENDYAKASDIVEIRKTLKGLAERTNKFSEDVYKQINENLATIKTVSNSLETIYEFNTIKHGLEWEKILEENK